VERESHVDALVIGGGLAGLTCAVGLVGEGMEVILVERDAMLGGRSRSWIDPVTGDPVHVGPHIFLDEYPNMWRLLETIGSDGHISWQPDGLFVTMVKGRERTEMRDAGWPPPYHFVPSLLQASNVRLRDLVSNWPVTSLAMRLDEDGVKRLDEESALAFLRRMGVSESFIDWYWRFTALAIMNVPLEVCSAGALLRFYKFQVGHAGIRVGFANTGLGDVFAPQARATIEAGKGQVWLETGVRRILAEGDSATGVELADGRKVHARYVVAATTPMALREILPRPWVDRHRVFADLVHFHPVPYISVYLWFDRRLTDLTFWARSYDPNDLNTDFYDLRNLYDGGSGDGGSLIATNIIWCHRAAALDDEQVVAETVRELSEFLPEAAEAKVVHQVVSRIPMAIHAPFPGTERNRPSPRTPVHGLVLAGDWVQTGFPSSMESAVRSGWLAAEAVLEDRTSLALEHRPAHGLAGMYERLPAAATAYGPAVALRMLGRAHRRLRHRPE